MAPPRTHHATTTHILETLERACPSCHGQRLAALSTALGQPWCEIWCPVCHGRGYLPAQPRHPRGQRWQP